jgi:hypothetical protein
MKAVFVSFVMVLVSFISHASSVPAGYTKVPESRHEDYQKAIYQALAQNPSVIVQCDQAWVYNTIQTLDEVLVNSKSAQPLLIVNSFYPIDERILYRLVISTGPDLKSISNVTAEVYKMGDVNTGDLAHPVIVEDYVLQSRVVCTPAPRP